MLTKIKSIEETYTGPYSDFDKSQKELESSFRKSIAPMLSKGFEGLTRVSKKDAQSQRKMKFMEEWTSTLTLLRKIASEVVKDENRPKWVPADAPSGVQVDQFLHAYYYSKVKPGQRSQHEEFHAKNKIRTDEAVKDAMSWWANLDKAVESEDIFISERAPFLLEHLSQSKLLGLNEDEFVQVVSKVNAFRTAARQTTNEDLSLDEGTKLQMDERVELVARWLWNLRARNGSGPKEVLNYILYGGPIEDLTDRIWDAAFTDKWHLPRMGLSTIGEIVGWAMPDKYPPRNGRTSKALSALGYEVTIYSQ